VAKLKAPLLSLGAAGAIGKTLVFFAWKGIDAVREYVIPTNPKTAEQTTQRGYLTAAVAAIHAAQALTENPLDQDDQVANSALATAKGKIMTWFNQMTKLWVDVKVDAKVPIVYRDGHALDPTVTAVDLRIYISEETGSTLAAGAFFLGLTKTNLHHGYAGEIFDGVRVALDDADIDAWANTGDKIWWQFRPASGDGCEGANSGIYHFTAT